MDLSHPSESSVGPVGGLIAGATSPVLRRHVTQGTIDAYAEASGDFNPIHVDPEFARTGPFGRTIAHGLMTLAYVAEMLNAWTHGSFDASGEIDIAFVGPVFAGDDVEVSGTVEETLMRDGERAARVKLNCKAGERQILADTATLSLIPPPLEQTRKA